MRLPHLGHLISATVQHLIPYDNNKTSIHQVC
jgi:hypothetical protein